MLARLALTEEEKNKYAEQLSAILDYAETLNKLSTDGIEPLAHVLPVFNVMRSDERKDSFPKEDMLANGPVVEEGQFKVPKIV